MKGQVVIGTGVAVLVVWSLFFGIGFGAGALSLASPAPLQGSCGGPGGIQFCVNFAIAPSLGGNYVSNWINGISTPITLSIQNFVGQNGSCDQGPGWLAGSGHQQAFVVISVIDSISGQPVSLSAQSTNSFSAPAGATVTQGPTSFVVSLNNSYTQQAWCYGSTSRSQAEQSDWTPITFTLTGQFDDYSRVSAAFTTGGKFCSGPGSDSACSLDGVGRTATSQWYGTATRQAYLRNGGGFFSWNGQTLYNGETFTVPVTTYYDAGQGFQIQFLYPSVRGSVVIATTTVPDEKTNFGVTFTVPANAAQNSTNPLYNQFQLALYSPVAQYTYQVIPVDISPLYAPPAPTAQFQDLSQHSPPQLGDQGSIAIAGNGVPSQKESIVTFILWMWYVTPTTPANSLPPPGSPAWITNGGQSGQQIPATVNGFNGTGSYPFSITQPYTIALQLESVTNTAQTSVAQTAFTIYVQPPGCTGPMCKTGVPAASFWQVGGPVLLSLGIILTSLLAAIAVPLPMPARYLLVGAGVAVVVVLLAFGWLTGAFVPGAIFNPGGK